MSDGGAPAFAARSGLSFSCPQLRLSPLFPGGAVQQLQVLRPHDVECGGGRPVRLLCRLHCGGLAVRRLLPQEETGELCAGIHFLVNILRHRQNNWRFTGGFTAPVADTGGRLWYHVYGSLAKNYTDK